MGGTMPETNRWSRTKERIAMSENQNEAGTTGDTGTAPVSDTAEQGTPATDQTPTVTDSGDGDGGTADPTADAPADGGDGDATTPEDRPASVRTSVTDGSAFQGDEKPVWNTATHGPLGEDDPRRENYKVI